MIGKHSVSALILVLCFAGTSRGGLITDFTSDLFPVLLGNTITLTPTVVPSGDVPVLYKWEVQGVGTAGNLGTWITQNNTITISPIMGRVGRLNVRLTVTYQGIMGIPAHTPSVIDHFIQVLPPDNDVVMVGLGVPLSPDPTGNTRVTLEFELRRGNTAIGGHFSGYAQENLPVWEGLNANVNPPVWDPIVHQGGWIPMTGTPTPFYYLSPNRIIDMKFSEHGVFWAAIQPNQTFQRITQQNRITVENWLSEVISFPLSTHYFKAVKISGGTAGSMNFGSYKFIETLVPIP